MELRRLLFKETLSVVSLCCEESVVSADSSSSDVDSVWLRIGLENAESSLFNALAS